MKTGLLILNLGTPKSPSVFHVGRYLREFLMDPYVVDIPAWARFLLVHGIIVPFRSFKSAHAYKSIWGKDGSPLRHYHLRLRDQLQTLLPHVSVAAGMRYDEPSTRRALVELQQRGVQKLVVWPLYPQWAWASTASSLEKVQVELKRLGWSPEVEALQDFFADPEFVQAFAARVRESLRGFQPDLVLMSFHGIPVRHLTKAVPEMVCSQGACCDQVTQANRTCYRAQCFASARAIAQEVGLDPQQVKVTFQSRLGRTPWISPYTDHVVREAAASGARKVLVVCPSFVADCLETLEEIAVRERESFIEAGGEDLRLVASLNDTWAERAAALLKRRCGVGS